MRTARGTDALTWQFERAPEFFASFGRGSQTSEERETAPTDEDQRSRVTPPSRGAAARRPHGDAAEVTEIDDFSFSSANGSRQGSCRPLNRHDPSPDVLRHARRVQ